MKFTGSKNKQNLNKFSSINSTPGKTISPRKTRQPGFQRSFHKRGFDTDFANPSVEENKVPDFNPSCNECSFVIKQNSLGNTDFENSNELYTDVLFETAKVKAFRKKKWLQGK